MCGRVAVLLQADENPFLIHEFEHSIFVVGDHQFFRGYSLLLLKKHQRELHELEPNVQAGLFAELMTAGRTVADTFKPWKMNYSCYGNVVPHIHWHLFPRYDSDPHREQVPWFHASEFEKHLIDAQTAQLLALKIKGNLILF
jgi:diadenosine tetraphosphate (Ap4A) HIT family hydrolase